MESYRYAIGIVLILSCFFTVSSFAADSTQVTTPAVSAIGSLQSIVVTHISASNIPANHTVNCPYAAAGTYSPSWTELSPVKNATIVGLEKWYPNGPTSQSTGTVVYRCAETYWSTDPYYIALTNANPTITCQSNSNELCTTKAKDGNAMSGIIPIRFRYIYPTQSMLVYINYGGRNIFMHQTSGTPVLVAPFGFQTFFANQPNVFEFSQKFTTGTTVSVGMYMSVRFYDQNGVYYGNAAQQNNYYCPGTPGVNGFGYTNLAITNNMIGQTCEISCTNPLGYWSYPCAGCQAFAVSVANNIYCHD